MDEQQPERRADSLSCPCGRGQRFMCGTHADPIETEAIQAAVIQAQVDVLRGAATGIEQGLRLGYDKHPDVEPWTRGKTAAVAAIRRTADFLEGGNR
jgi:hypothetical protein